jgi:Domain of unknown function (DUF4279)
MKIDFQLWATTISPKEISTMTGISPDVQLLKGERNPHLELPRANLWVVSSKSDSDLVEDHWQYLEGLVQGKWEILKRVASTGRAKLTVFIDPGFVRIPSIIISPSMAAFSSYLNATIDIDHLQ